MTEEEFNALAEPVIEDTAEDVETLDITEEQQEETEPEDAQQEQEQEQQTQQEEQTAEPPQMQITGAQAAKQARLEQEYKEAFNKINPYTGKPIQSPEDFFSYKRQYNAELENSKRQRQAQDIFDGIKNGTATQADFDRYVQTLVSNSPDLQASKALALKMEQMERQSKVESGRAKLQADIDALNKEYPACEIKKVEDIKDREIVGYLRRGLSIADAYYLAHRNEMIEAQKAGVRQAVVNQANGKKHLQTTANNSKGEEPIPDDVISEYEKFFPDWSKKQIVEDYKKRKGGK